ncbi:ImmA/IrrE family metallo-endopeptidase [Ensifer aridi]|uniref:ImmA/IrrE family metallo-endopeptidase n=1 Tax=Ensifer aridi TaxID=1708715 RepID=UPI00358E0564
MKPFAREAAMIASVAILSVAIATACIVWGKRSTPTANLSRILDLVHAASLTQANGFGRLSDYEFFVPLETIDYSNDFTYGQLTSALEKLYNKPRDQISTKMGAIDFIRWVASSYTRIGTKFSKIEINKAPSQNELAILLIDQKYLSDATDIEVSTCAFIGYSIILCDLQKLILMLDKINRYSDNKSVVLAAFEGEFTQGFRVNFTGNLDDLRALLRQNFLTWVIGHEVGHAVLHSRLANSEHPLHFDLRYDHREEEADLFVIDRLRINPAINASFAPLLLEFFEQEFSRQPLDTTKSQSQSIENGLNDGVRIQFNSDTALLLRGFNMLVTLVTQDPTALQKIQLRPVGGHFGFVHSVKTSAFVRDLNIKISVATATYNRDWIVWIVLSACGVLVVVILCLLRRGSKR